MKHNEIIKSIVPNYNSLTPHKMNVTAFAPSNIALGKYWGKRNQELNLPVTSSLSVSLKNKGATVSLKVKENKDDLVILNNEVISPETSFSQRLICFLNLFRSNELYFEIDIKSTIPIAAGLASSAAGFASVVLALNELYDWQLNEIELSILARLGSGSACRSLWPGFVEWIAGERSDGMDSHGQPISANWPDLCIGLCMVSSQKKSLSSRAAMQRTVSSGSLYSAWPDKVEKDLILLKKAIAESDFNLLGKTAESNALAMHATMLSAWPPISYCLPETISVMNRIWQLREEGLSLYFTQDAGPNLKLLFLKNELDAVLEAFPGLEVIHPF